MRAKYELFCRGKNHQDVSSFGDGRFVHNRFPAEHFEETLHNVHTHGCVRLLTATHSDGNLYLVSVLQHFHRFLCLYLQITHVDRHRKIHFFDFDHLLIFAVFLFTLRLLELELTIVHDLAYRGYGVRGDLYKIQILFFGKTQCLCRAHNPELFAVCGNDSYFLITDITVDLMLVFNGRVPRKK